MDLKPKIEEFRETLEITAPDYGLNLSDDVLDRLCDYYQLLSRWNPRLHLVAPTTPDKFATRHVLESLLLLKHLPEDAKVADVGSGGGLPIIPCLIARRDIKAFLIESSKKKAVFLREALAQTSTSKQARVIEDRFENIEPLDVEFVTSRALERFEKILPRLANWAPSGARLLLFGGEGLKERLEELNLNANAFSIPDALRRYLFVVNETGKRS